MLDCLNMVAERQRYVRAAQARQTGSILVCSHGMFIGLTGIGIPAVTPARLGPVAKAITGSEKRCRLAKAA